MSKLTTAGLPLLHAAFSKPPLHIPNRFGEPYKTELVEVRTDEQTIKWNFWHGPDDLRAPHNHPWDFEATIFHGGYTELRYWIHQSYADHFEVRSEEKRYKAGDVNVCTRDIFHLVTHVEPGTVTRMVCGPASKDNEWGYLNISTATYEKAEPDPAFLERLRANNRFLMPK